MEITHSEKTQEQWSEVIAPGSSMFSLRLNEVWRYRDLLMLLVRRDFVATYKQTILGPIWFFLQPLLTMIIYVIVFGNMAKLSTDQMPSMPFYLAGITLWNYFSECLTRTATVFKDNAAVFGKVYFPRLVMPISIILSNLVKLAIQLLLFLGFWTYHLVSGPPAAVPGDPLPILAMHPNALIALTPVLVLLMGGMGLGFGMLISAMTTKYRDLIFMLTFGVQLLMYATPVIYPLSSALKHSYKWLVLANPMTPIIETFRYAFLGKGVFSWAYLGYSAAFTIIIMLLGTVVFNKVEKSFMDTV